MNLIIWALLTALITVGTWVAIVAYDREKRRRLDALEARLQELDDTRRQVAELESRLEFAERLLEQKPPAPEERR